MSISFWEINTILSTLTYTLKRDLLENLIMNYLSYNNFRIFRFA